jgi:hypothetical protein
MIGSSDASEVDAQVIIGGAEGDRTLDLRIANATLSQLSYRPNSRHFMGRRKSAQPGRS